MIQYRPRKDCAQNLQIIFRAIFTTHLGIPTPYKVLQECLHHPNLFYKMLDYFFFVLVMQAYLDRAHLFLRT